MITFNKFLNLVLRPFNEFSIGPLAALGIGAAGSALGGLFGGKSQERAAELAARAAAFRPVGSSTGFGTTGYDAEGGITQQLSPEYQALRDQLLGAGQAGLDQFQTFDPNQAGQLFTQQLNQLAAPQEEQARLGLESRLFSQGLLGGTTGQMRQEALGSAQGIAQGQRDLTGMQLGQQQQERLFQNALGGIQGAATLDQLLAGQQNQALAAGGAQTLAATTGAKFQFEAGQNRGDAISGFFSNLGQGFANQAFAPQQQTGNIFNQPYSSYQSGDFGEVF